MKLALSGGDPGKHAQEKTIALLCQSEHLHVVDEVGCVEVLTIAIHRIPPDVVIVKDVFEFAEPIFDGVSLGRADAVSVGIFEVDEGVGLPGDIIA